MKARFTLETSFFGIDKASPVLKRAFSAKRIWPPVPWQQKQARFNPDATDRKSSLAGIPDPAPEITRGAAAHRFQWGFVFTFWTLELRLVSHPL